MRIASPQGQGVVPFQCSTSGRNSWQAWRSCHSFTQRSTLRNLLFGDKCLTYTAYQSCQLQLGLSRRYFSCRRLYVLCSAEDSTGNGGGEGSTSNSADTSGNTSGSSNSSTNAGREESAPDRRPRTPKSGRSWSWLLRLAGKLRIQSPIRFILNLVALVALMRFWPMPGARHPLGIAEPVTVQVAFSEFVKYVRKAEVGRVMIDGNTFAFTMKPHSALYKELPEGIDRTQISFQTIRPKDYPTPYDTMLSNGIQFSAVDKKAGRYSNIMTYAFWAMLLVVALNRLPLKLSPRGAGRRHSSSGGSGSSQQPTVTFDDVAGVDEAKEELKEVVDFLKFPEKFSRLGARPPSGVLLIGPPGTGKTLLAKAVAGEAEVPFFSISASEFVELYVGMGAMRVRELFAAARKEAPAIVFIDEIDAVAKGRDSRLRSVGNDEREQTLNQLLTELDGFETQKEALVICIAATNRPDVLDPALLRPGRFDRRVAVERPDRQGRAEILRVHIGRRQLPLDTDVSVDTLAAQTTGFTGADLANLVNEAALLAGRGDKGSVGQADFDHAVLRAVAGVEKKRSILKGLEKSVVARHEIGHALVSTAVAAIIPGSPSVEKLSIIPRSGGALGFTYIPPATEDRALMFDSEIRGQLAMLMGGRAAEELTCDSISTGAVDDIRRATDLAYKAVSEYGLNAAVGPMSVAALGGGDDYGAVLKDSGGAVARMVEQEVRLLCEGALWVAREVVVANRALHDQLSAELERDEKMEGGRLQERLRETSAPELLRRFVLQGEIPEGARSRGRLPQ